MWFPTYKDNKYWNIVKEMNLPAALKQGKLNNFALQGELCGPGIQGNKYKLEKPVVFIYGCYDITKQEYATPADLKLIVDTIASLANCKDILKMVPILEPVTIMRDIGTTVDEWMKYATTKSVLNPDTYNEGIVVRSLDNKPYAVKGMNGRRFSFKVVSSEFLLQWGL
jgi:hypothetical protein